MSYGDAFLELCERHRGNWMELVLKSGARLGGTVGRVVTIQRSVLVGANNVNADEVASFKATSR